MEDKNMALSQHDGIEGTRGLELDSTTCSNCALIVRNTLFVGLCTAALQSAFAVGQEYTDALEKATVAGDFAPLFPFKVTHGSPDNITNVQTWEAPWKPAGHDGFVKTVDSQFVTERGPRYFTGTNICFGGCFPEHDEAEKVAVDMARFGINLVRLHYVHHRFPPEKKYSSPDSLIEPVQLEKFDYLFHQLKERGIYAYMQLNIAQVWKGIRV